jgi:hypothetical protein
MTDRMKEILKGQTPIYDLPAHRFYGPVRRLHVMCLQLFPNFAEVERRFETINDGIGWTHWMMHRMRNNGVPEATVQRDMLRWFLSIHR